MKKYVFLPLLSFLSLLTIKLPAQDWANGGNTLGANGTLGTNSNHSLLFETANTPRGILTNTGVWHFGATSVPTVSKVQITHNSASGNPHLMLYEPANDYVRLYFKNTNTASYFGIAASPASTTAASKLNFLYSPTGDIMTILGNKRVGIGTTNPATTLHVVGNTALTGSVGIGTTTPAYSLHVLGTIYGTSATNAGVFGHSSYSSGEGVRGQGNYIGVYGYAGAYGLYGVCYSTTSGYGVYGSGLYGVFGLSTIGGGTAVNASASGIDGHGVHASSTQSIGVYGYTGNSASYAGYFAGRVYTTNGYFSPSDKNLKQNINDFSSAMGIIDKLHPKTYEFRQDGNYKLMNLPRGKHYGLIAQEIEEVLPDLVHESQFNVAKAKLDVEKLDIDKQPKAIQANSEALPITLEAARLKGEVIDHKTVNYTELIPIIIKAMQEQQQVIEQQHEVNEGLQQQISELKEVVNKLANSGRGNVNIRTAYLEGVAPNPTSGYTLIRYHLPSNVMNAKIIITDMKGSMVRSIGLNKSNNQVRFNSGGLAAGTYTCTLYVDGQQADAMQMMVGR